MRLAARLTRGCALCGPLVLPVSAALLLPDAPWVRRLCRSSAVRCPCGRSYTCSTYTYTYYRKFSRSIVHAFQFSRVRTIMVCGEVGARELHPRRAAVPLPNMSLKRSRVATLEGQVVAVAAPLVYEENENGSYYLTNPTLKMLVEHAGGKLQSGPANSSTTIFVKGSISKESHNGEDLWTGSKKHVALEAQLNLAGSGRRAKPFAVLSFTEFVSKFDLTDEVEHELLWAFTHHPNQPPPSQRTKHFFGIGNTCVVYGNAYEKSIGLTGGYSRGRYLLHNYGAWPDADVLIEMNERHRPAEKKAKGDGCTSSLEVD